MKFFIYISFLLLFLSNLNAKNVSDYTIDELSQMSLKELLEIEVQNSAISDYTTYELSTMNYEELIKVIIEGSTLTKQNLLSVPSSVTAFTQREIKRLGVTTLDELMNYAPGFQSRRSSDGSKIISSTVRGHTSGTSGKNILILIDSQRINNDWFGGTSLTYPVIALENVEKVEFIRGAGSSLYGSNAFSAVINITTINDKNEITSQVSDHSFSASALMSVKDEDLLVSGFVKTVNDSGEDYSNVTNTIDPNGDTTTQDPYSSIDLYLQAKYKNTSLYISHAKREVDDFYIFRRLSDINDVSSKHSFIRLTHDMDISSKYHSKVSVSYSQSNRQSTFATVKAGVFGTAELINKGNVKEETPSIEWFNSYKLDSKHSFIFGAEYRHPNITNLEIGLNYDIINNPPQIPFYNSDFYTFPLGKETSRDIYGIYGQYQGNILDDFLLTLGLRYDDYSDFGGSLNPRVALVYKAKKDMSFKFLYSRAFRAPSRNDLDLINNGILKGNPDLDAETIDTYEVIAIKQYKNHSLSLSYYYNQMHDIIVDVTQSDGTILRENAQNGKFTGLEVEYISNPLKYFQTRLSYSHIFSKPDFAFRSSDDIASAILNYSRKNYNINLSAFYHSDVKNNDNGTFIKLPSYTLVNTKLLYHIYKDIDIHFYVKNLFDKEYFTPSNGSSFTYAVPNRGRESFIGLTWKF